MPWIVYKNPDAFPNEKVLLPHIGAFQHDVPKRVDGDLLRQVLGDVTEAGHYARNLRFFPAMDPEIAAVVEAGKQRAAAQTVELEGQLEARPADAHPGECLGGLEYPPDAKPLPEPQQPETVVADAEPAAEQTTQHEEEKAE